MLNKNIIDNMKYIVENCMGEEKAGCVVTCPMHTDAKGYIGLIKDGKEEEAIKLIREKLFIPATLGRICAHPCEGECKWKEVNSPISIASLKRYVADNFDDENNWDLTKEANTNKKVAIIGAGPAGLQAAIDIVRAGHDVVVFDKLPVRGGMMAVGIPEYRLPRTVLEKEISYLDKLGVEFKLNCEIGKDVTLEELDKEFDAIVVAVGKHQGRVDKSIENHDAKGVFSATEYLKEAALTRDVKEVGKKVLVIGGGDVAIDCCRVSKRLSKVETVYSACLEESFDTMASSNHEIKGAIIENIKFNHARAIDKIEVKNERVSKVILKKCISMFDKEGRFSPKFDNNDLIELEVDTVVFAIGQGTDGEFAKGILNQRPNTTFECDKLTLQSIDSKKMFIAGDVSDESVIVIQAMATGRRAAQSVNRFLANESLTKGRSIEDTSSYKTKLSRDVDWSNIEYTRVDMKELDVDKRLDSFDEVAIGYTKEEARKEANRCKQCACKLCMKECIMMNDYTDCPKTLFKEYLEKGYENMNKMIAFSCNDCSQCTIECPKSFDIKSNFVAIKEQYIEDNNGENVIESLKPFDKSQAMECSDEYSVTVKSEAGKKTKYLFVPGCTVPAYNPLIVEQTLAHLRESLDGEVGAMLQCCGKVTKLVGEDVKYKERNQMAIEEINETNADVIITICPSCYKVYQNTSDKKVISYWDLMREEIGIPHSQKDKGINSDVVFNIHDSCVTRDVVSHHENVRWMLDELGYKYEEMNRNRENTRCCGVGGMVCSSNPELYERIYTRRATDCTQENVVTYCGSCRGTMEAAGKDALHILDLLHGEKYMKHMESKRSYKSEEEMWGNRLETKSRLAKYNK